MRLDPTVAAAGTGLIVHDIIGSTNTEACVLGRRGESRRVWIVAKEQTAGRGRRGNVWVSKPGNLYGSLLLPGIAAARAGGLAFVAGLAVHDALVALAPALAPQLMLKWPNDVLFDGAKIAGILIEAEQNWAVIGIGINCAQHPEATEQRATDLTFAGASMPVDAVFAQLSKTMFARLSQWAQGAGFSAIRADWLERAAGVGEDIRVRLPAKELSGQFQGLDESGHLLLRLSDGTLEAISSGEVFALHAVR
jgi:BirA family biotin operon repressor/biotin-[acetyl-CoA-carboxylase] ligase